MRGGEDDEEATSRVNFEFVCCDEFARRSTGRPNVPPHEEKQFTVRIRNYVRIDPGVLFKAETVASKILQEASVNTVWVVCFDGIAWSKDMACANLPGPMDLTVASRLARRLERSGAASNQNPTGSGASMRNNSASVRFSAPPFVPCSEIIHLPDKRGYRRSWY